VQMGMLGAVGSTGFIYCHWSIAKFRKTFRMSTPVRELLGGAKMASQVYPIRMDYKTLHFHFGTKKSEFSRRIQNVCDIAN
jgi:hypothetical protein